MAIIQTSGVQITGICSVLPGRYVPNTDLAEVIGEADIQKIIDSTGIAGRRVSGGETALAMARQGASELLSELNWAPDSVGLLMMVTQSADFPLPGNAVQLQHQLGLDKSAACFDVNLGCSGFVYGLWQLTALLQGMNCERALLVVGDTTSQQIADDDRKVAPLFGDGVSVIAVEKQADAAPMTFTLGTDGAGAPYLIQPNGGALNPGKAPALFMEGTQVFVFTLREVPACIKTCLDTHGWSTDELDYLVLHQANKMMLTRLGDKVGVTGERLPMDFEQIGNTSSASIPLVMTGTLAESLKNGETKLAASGFGVGWSWGTVAMTVPPLSCCKTIDFETEA
ncbi:ketoacyl-ACP synthase III [Shewanella corallii]|uniref:Ketoacyl-ACP synthase III n=1 Tax=Shewanella corallii TaxID=560080 RepID=A0ABT0N3Y8_9GAMM|nr:ketoacyl-ACP synthase III [Shewanella corallii]MCL2913065.1 ketoacyl-ACP synthase III [Shewanella corallii]